MSGWLIRRTESLNLFIHNAFYSPPLPSQMLIVFAALLCVFYNFEHLFLSISHGTGHSISVSLFTAACPMLPDSVFPFTLMSLNPGATSALLITTEALNLMLSCEAVLTSPSLLFLLQRSRSSDLQTLPASFVTEYIYLHADMLRLFGLE